MENSIENILATILSSTSNESAKKTDENKLSISEINPSTEKSMKIQKKIDILNVFLPIVGERNKEHINFFIKALTIAKLISDMDDKE